MSEKINVLDIRIDRLLAKEALKSAMEYMDSEPVSVIELVTIDSLMQMKEEADLREKVSRFDLVLAGDRAILEAAEVSERRILQETDSRAFLKMFMRYLHKRHKRVYLLVESEQEGEELYHYLQSRYKGLQIVGLAKLSATNRADEMIVNAVNGGEVDCVLAALSAPLQEEFISENRGLLNARLWLGIGSEIIRSGGQRPAAGRITHFILKHIFKKEIEKQKNKK